MPWASTAPIGELRQTRDEHTQAIALLRTAASAWRKPLWRARTLRALGDAQHGAGETAGAASAWTQSHALFVGMGSPEATEVADRLAAATR